jgi:hypothetical protein
MANGLMSFSLPVDFSSFRHRQKGPRARQDACKLLGAWDSLRKRFEVSGLEENKEGVYVRRIESGFGSTVTLLSGNEDYY